jgi:hypothetical protein
VWTSTLGRGRVELRAASGRLRCVPVLVLALSAAAGCGASRRTNDHGAGAGTTAGSGGSSAGFSGDTGGATPAGGTPAHAGEDSGSGRAGEAGAGSGGQPPMLGDCTDFPATSQIPRLRNEQFDNTIRDLLGVTALTAHGNVAPSELLTADYDGDMNDIAWAAYQVVGEAIAAQVMADSELKQRFLACSPEDGGSACWRETIVRFGRRAFRRPLTESEIARFEAIVAQGAAITETGSADEVAEVVLNTFLVSPSFIQRAELSDEKDANGDYVLSSFEVAARLSYLLWRTTPDEALELAADAGELGTREGVLEHARRMIDDPRAEHVVRAFHRHYVRLDAGWYWNNIQKDAAKFPAFTPAAVPAMIAETEKFFETLVLRDRRSFRDLFTSPLAFVNADLAPLYGLDPGDYGATLVEVALDEHQRPGFLTRAGFLAAHAGFDRSSPTLRGTFIMRDVLGLDVEAPIGGPFLPPPAGEPGTNRDLVEALTASPQCMGCHSILDPPGFVLEHFDGVGKWQTIDPSGLPVDPVADVLIDERSVTIHDPAELMAAIAASTDARRKYAETWVSFAYERIPNELDACWVETLALRLTDSGYRVIDLMAELTQAPSFRLRARAE